ncbi:MAG: hypothetical protein QW701_03215 [Candidatus Nezhaarchaeales archaeon]
MIMMAEIHLTKRFDVLCEIEPYEDPDWDYARNKHVLLKDILLEYSTSNFDAPIATPIGLLHGGNRDFSWQGLLVGPLNNRLYKVLDAIYYKPIGAESLKPITVTIGRRSARYAYVDDRGDKYEVTVSIRVEEGRGVLEASASRPSIFAPLLAFYDMDTCVESNFKLIQEGEAITVEPETIPLSLKIRGFSEVYKLELSFDWIYKLGDGFRTLEGGKPYFVRHVRRVRMPIALKCDGGTINVEVPLKAWNFKRIDLKVKGKLKRLRRELEERIRGKVSVKVIDALVLRVDRLLGFGIPLNSILAPEAGAMWFKRVWARDLLEGLRWNLLTYTTVLGLSSWLVELVRKLLLEAKELKGLKTFLREGDYSSDAFPQLMSIAAKLYYLTGEKALVREALRLTSTALKLMRAGDGFSGCIIRDGLILCRANSSWMDVIYAVNDLKWPTRLPLNWMWKVSPQDLFALVEVNALFIEGLDSLLKAAQDSEVKADKELHDVKCELLDGYKKWFYSRSSLPPLTIEPSSNLRDETPSSAGVVALTILKGIAYGEELSSMWSSIEAMTVKRRLVSLGSSWEPFGIIARRVEERPYLGDLEYHGPVIWPRDTPYLVEVMKVLGLDPYGILVNNLDHMISEGAIGYCNELFSLPIGINPSYLGETSLNPVPVKNYAQYWSHWCDPFVEYFLLKG